MFHPQIASLGGVFIWLFNSITLKVERIHLEWLEILRPRVTFTGWNPTDYSRSPKSRTHCPEVTRQIIPTSSGPCYQATVCTQRVDLTVWINTTAQSKTRGRLCQPLANFIIHGLTDLIIHVFDGLNYPRVWRVFPSAVDVEIWLK